MEFKEFETNDDKRKVTISNEFLVIAKKVTSLSIGKGISYLYQETEHFKKNYNSRSYFVYIRIKK